MNHFDDALLELGEMLRISLLRLYAWASRRRSDAASANDKDAYGRYDAFVSVARKLYFEVDSEMPASMGDTLRELLHEQFSQTESEQAKRVSR